MSVMLESGVLFDSVQMLQAGLVLDSTSAMNSFIQQKINDVY